MSAAAKCADLQEETIKGQQSCISPFETGVNLAKRAVCITTVATNTAATKGRALERREICVDLYTGLVP